MLNHNLHIQETLLAHRLEKERLLAAQEKEGQPRHVAQIRRARTSLPTNDENGISSFARPSSPAAHPTSISSLCPPNDASNINIICCWSALVGNEGEDERVYGQHHLRNLMVRPQNKSKGCPLSLTANYTSKASHKFDERPLVSYIISIFYCMLSPDQNLIRVFSLYPK